MPMTSPPFPQTRTATTRTPAFLASSEPYYAQARPTTAYSGYANPSPYRELGTATSYAEPGLGAYSGSTGPGQDYCEPLALDMPGHSESDYAQPLALDSLYSQGSSGYVEPVALDSPYSQASPGYVQPVTMMPLYSEPQVSAQSIRLRWPAQQARRAARESPSSALVVQTQPNPSSIARLCAAVIFICACDWFFAAVRICCCYRPAYAGVVQSVKIFGDIFFLYLFAD